MGGAAQRLSLVDKAHVLGAKLLTHDIIRHIRPKLSCAATLAGEMPFQLLAGIQEPEVVLPASHTLFTAAQPTTIRSECVRQLAPARAGLVRALTPCPRDS